MPYRLFALVIGLVAATFSCGGAIAAAPYPDKPIRLVLGVGSDRRFAGLPDVPTMAEAGIGNYNVSSWTGIAVPLGTPVAIVNRLSREARAVASIPAVRQSLQKIGIEARASTPEEASKLTKDSVTRWSGVIELAKIERR